MMSARALFGKLAALLRVRAQIGGLEVTDAALRFGMFNDTRFAGVSVRLAPGVLERGRIKDRTAFVAALTTLRTKHLRGKTTRRPAVVVSLSSAEVYAQVFSLPAVEEDRLEEAVRLNLKMVAPGELEGLYAGWQQVGRSEGEGKVEVLAAFIERVLVDELVAALEEARFLVVALEPRAFSLVRAIAQHAHGIDATKPHLVLSVNSDGIDVLVLRHGHFHFGYFKSWGDLGGGAQRLPFEQFRALLLRTVQQVLTFYISHWASEPVEGMVVVASALENEVQAAFGARQFSFPVMVLALTPDLSLTPEWFVVAGAALRGATSRRADHEVTLLGVDVVEELQREEVVAFAHFWRVAIPAVLVVLASAFLVANVFATRMRARAVAQPRAGTADVIAELEGLEGAVTDFNALVTMLARAVEERTARYPSVVRLAELLAAHDAVLTRLSVQGGDGRMVLAGEAGSEQRIANLKKALEESTFFADVELPLNQVTPIPGGFSFVMSFRFSAERTQ